MQVIVIEPKKKQMLRAAAYCRVSTEKDSQYQSLETQYQSWMDTISHHPGWTFAGIYADEGKSGTHTLCRPEFNRMMEDARMGKIDLILVKSISRFSRNIADCQNYARELRQLGVELLFEKEGISNMNPSSEFIFSILSVAAQAESRNLSEHIRWTVSKNYEKGIHRLGNNRVLGYDTIYGKLVPNQDAWIVKQAFEAYAQGKLLSQVAEELNAAGAKRLRSEKKFNNSSIKYILKNEIYKGDRYLHKKPPIDLATRKPAADYTAYYVSEDHIPVISPELWELVQNRLAAEEDRAEKGLAPAARHIHPLYGHLFCAECGEPLTRKTYISSKSGKYKAWKCRGVQRKNGCTSHILKETEIFRLLRKELNAERSNVDKVNVEKTNAERSNADNVNADKTNIDKPEDHELVAEALRRAERIEVYTEPPGLKIR